MKIVLPTLIIVHIQIFLQKTPKYVICGHIEDLWKLLVEM